MNVILPFIHIYKRKHILKKLISIPFQYTYMYFPLEIILIIGFDLNVNYISLGDSSIVFCFPNRHLKNLCQNCYMQKILVDNMEKCEEKTHFQRVVNVTEAGLLGPLKARTNLTQFAQDSVDSQEELGLRLRKRACSNALWKFIGKERYTESKSQKDLARLSAEEIRDVLWGKLFF